MFKTAVLKLSFGIADVLMLEVVIEITKLQRKFTSSKYVIPTIYQFYEVQAAVLRYHGNNCFK